MKKNWIYCLLLLIVPMIFFACSKDSSSTTLVGNWTEYGDLSGAGRSGAVCFTIGDTVAYVGLGYNYSSKYLKDFYMCDSKNSFIPIDTFPGVARTNAVAFSVNGKGYVGTGYDGNNYLNDFWEYNPGTGKWRQVKTLSAKRRGAVSFAINNVGYVGGGYNGDNYLKDYWKYTADGDSGSWSAIASPSKLRAYAVAFVLDKNGSKAFVTTGERDGSYLTDLIMYDPSKNEWTSLRDIANTNTSESYDDKYNIVRSYASSFVISNKAYVSCGYNNGVTATTWEYDPSTDLWTQKTNFEGSPRSQAVGFSINNQGFVGLGASGYYGDFWQLKPNDEYDAYK
jgi:Uncharacterized protein conserved in bacteria